MNYSNILRLDSMPNVLIFFVLLISFAVPVFSDSRVILFDFLAIWISISKYKTLLRSSQIKILVSLFFIYSIIMMLSLVIYDLPILNYFRRFYAVLFLVIEVFGLYLLIHKSDLTRQGVIILAVMLGISMHYFYPTDERVKEMPIKFLLGIPFGIIVAQVLAHEKVYVLGRRALLSAGLLLYSMFCILAGSRYIGGVFFISSILVWVKFSIAQKKDYKLAFPLIFLFGLISIYMFSEIYTYLAIRGLFGETAQSIAEYQSQFFGNILIGGRPEVIVNMIAFLDSPLIGQGPISQNPVYIALMAGLGIYSESIVLESDEIIYHSVLFTAAHEAGFIATLIWLYLIYKILFAIPIVISMNNKVSFIALPLMISGVWNILFSPLISYNRWSIAFAVMFAFIANERQVKLINNYKKNKKRIRGNTKNLNTIISDIADNKMGKLLIYEPESSGHRMIYIIYILRLLPRDRQLKVILLTSEESGRSEIIKKIIAEFNSLLIVVTVDIKKYNTPILYRFNSKISRHVLYTQVLRKYLFDYKNIEDIEYIFIPFIDDYCLFTMPFLSNPFMGIKCSGIAIRPRFHLKYSDAIVPWRWEDIIEKYLYGLMLKRKIIDRVFCIDEYFEKYYNSDKVIAVPDPADIIKIKPEYTSFNIFKDDVILLVYGYIDGRKAIDRLFSAMLNEKVTLKLKVIIAGQQDSGIYYIMYGETARLLRKQGRLFEVNRHINDNEEAGLFMQADIVWNYYPGSYCSSGALVRAGQSSSPVIATKQGLVGLLVSKIGMGITIDEYDNEGLVDGLKKIVDDKALRKNMGESGLKYFSKSTSEYFADPIVSHIKSSLKI